MALDGTGHRLYQFLLGLAVAAENRMKYRVLCPAAAECKRVAHHSVQGGVDFMSTIRGIFGDEVGSRIIEPTCLFPECMAYSNRRAANACKMPVARDGCSLDFDIDNVKGVVQARPGMHEDKGVLLRRPNTIHDEFPHLPLRLMAAMRENLLKYPLPFKVGKPSVALHMRRGDVGCAKGRQEQTHEKAAEGFRLVPDESWVEFIEDLRKVMPDPDVHAYSATSAFLKGDISGPGHKGCWEDSDFDFMRQNGVTMHLDEQDLVPLLTAWQRAHVFAHSLSHLSEIASYTSAYCTIGVKEKLGGASRYTRFKEKHKMNYFFEWRPRSVLKPHQLAKQQEQLEECVAHALQMGGGGWDLHH